MLTPFCMSAENVMSEPSAPQVFEPFSYPLESSVGMGTASLDLAGQPAQGLGDMPYSIDDLKQEDLMGPLDTDTMTMLSTILNQMLEEGNNTFPMPNLTNQDENSNFHANMNFGMEDPSLPNMNMYTEMQFNQMVSGSGSHHVIPPNVLDMIDQNLGSVEGHAIPQVKTEKEGDV